MPNYAAIAKKPTPQRQAIPGRESEMEKNAAGGYGFKLDSLTRLRRFLILGSAGGTYYVGETDHTKQNFATIKEALDAHSINAVDLIVDVSVNGLAQNNKPALFALACAAAHSNPDVKSVALIKMPSVARTGSDLLYFASQVNEMRGWGRGLRRAISAWFLSRNPDNLAYQAMKYRQRDGWALADLLRLSHPKTEEKERNAIFKWIVDNAVSDATPERMMMAHHAIKGEIQLDNLAEFTSKFRLPREVLPTEALNRLDVWQALLEDMPGHAMLRNLGKMTSINGLLKPLSKGVAHVVNPLSDPEYLKKARIHPLQILLARYVYGLGHGMKGSLKWEPITQIMEALDQAFYSAFDEANLTKKTAVIGIDVSSSMRGARCTGQEHIDAATGSAMLAMTLKRTIPNCQILTFDTGHRVFQMTGQPDIQAVQDQLGHYGGGTDCAQPFIYCQQNKLEPDAMIVITDNETWAGKAHAVEILGQMRTKKPVKAIVVAMQAISTSIADKHQDNLDVVGFDASIAKIITDFMEGRV